ncbi:MAG: methyltransferase [Microgenomates group bacterium]
MINSPLRLSRKDELKYFPLLADIEFEKGSRVLILNPNKKAFLNFLGAIPNVAFCVYQDNLEEEKEIDSVMDSDIPIGNVDLLTKLPASEKFDGALLSLSNFMSQETFDYWLRRLANYLREGGVIYVITHKNWGLEGQGEVIKKVLGEMEIIAKGRGGYRILRAIKRNNEVQEKQPTLVRFNLFGRSFEMRSLPGLFSWQELDEGTRFLLEETEGKIRRAEKILDLGCGWGVIGVVAGFINEEAEISMVDVSRSAILISEENVRNFGLLNRTKLYLGIESVPSEEFDLVLSNPPFHKKREDLSFLFRDVKKKIKKGGEIFLVVGEGYKNIFLEILKEAFGFCEVIGERTTKKGKFFILRSRK